MKYLVKGWLQLLVCLLLVLGGVSLAQGATPTAPTLTVSSVAKLQDGQPAYFNYLTVDKIPDVTYVIEREVVNQSSTKVKILEMSYDTMAKYDFQFIDFNNLQKHQKYLYSAYTVNAAGETSAVTQVTIMVKNIQPITSVSGPPATVAETVANFTLGRIQDAEGDSLEYRLYTRTPGGGNMLRQKIWRPTADNQLVQYTFANNTNCEYMVTCLESDYKITDRSEVNCFTEWQPLKVDTATIFPRCYNDFGMATWGTKMQPLKFTVAASANITISKVEWDFGDGSAAVTGVEVTHAFAKLTTTGNPYVVTAKAYDQSGNTYQNSIKITISNTPKGRLYADETWEGTHSIEGDVVVPAGITLTINPGAAIQALTGSRLIVAGALQAKDSGKQIKFDIQDQVSSWKGLEFSGQGTGELQGVTIAHAERGLAAASSGKVDLSNCLFDSNSIGVHCYSSIMSISSTFFNANRIYGIKEDNGADPQVNNCVFQSNGIPYYDQAKLHISQKDLNSGLNSGNVFAK